MNILQKKTGANGEWQILRNDAPSGAYNLVLVFGGPAQLENQAVFENLKKEFPEAIIILCSTAGEITGTEVSDDTLSVTAIHFEGTKLKAKKVHIREVKSSYEAGKRLPEGIAHEDLANVFVISDGQKVNGSDLVMGLQQTLPAGTIITGGLAADGSSFKRTLVGLNEYPKEGWMVILGFYGKNIHVGYGTVGGWDAFGPERLITGAKANVLYELDGKPALDIYKMYLGEYASELPGSGLLFPLSLRIGVSDPLVRTILAVNEKEKSVTFAGNMPEGNYARLMKANMDRLVEGASNAAFRSVKPNEKKPDLAILISCVGRKLLLGQRVEEEVEVVRAVYGDQTVMTGFYSYGEIAPSFNFINCELHNQTMSITTLTETTYVE